MAKLDTTGTITDINIDFKTSKAKISLLLDTKHLNIVEELKNEGKLNVGLKKYRKKRSLDANAYFHVLINELARHFNISDDEMKIKMNLDYGTIARFEDGRIKGCKVPEGTNIKEFYKYAKWYKTDEEGNDCYIFYKETHTLNTKEMSQLIEGVVQECKHYGVETKPQEEIDSLLKEWDKK